MKTTTTAACPYCHSTNITAIGERRKSFSVGKMLGGAILLGGIGAAAGFIGKKGKYQCYCQDCGRRFQMK